MIEPRRHKNLPACAFKLTTLDGEKRCDLHELRITKS